VPRTSLLSRARHAVDSAPVVDSHEHLLREDTRRAGAGSHDLLPCSDAALLLHHYGADDLASAGMPDGERHEAFAAETRPQRRWAILEPWLRRTGTTGYVRAVRETARLLFGEPRLDRAAFLRISERMLDPSWTAPGMHHRLLDAAGVAWCEVQSLEALGFDESAPRDPRIRQDVCVDGYTTRIDLDGVAREWGRPVRSLEEMEAALDALISRRAGNAAAVKSCALYSRRLDVSRDDPRRAAAALRALRDGRTPALDSLRALEDRLLRRAFDRAAQQGLPVRLHMGMCAGADNARLDAARHAAADVEPILAAHPDTTFVLMHAGWPAQDEVIALAKAYANATVDMCWAWIVNPVAAERFVVEYLAAAPAAKLHAFGGDYPIAETVIGHLAIARGGLARALARAVELDVLDAAQLPETARLLLHDNVTALVPALREDSALQQVS
jgi:predicted TIM-barrel fold metal-dependent hydrolase